MDPESVRALASFVGHAPPCQLSDVLKGCKILAATSSLPNEISGQACREHNESLLLPVVLPTALGGDGSVGVICSSARSGSEESTYVDPRGKGRTFQVDHEKQECTSVMAGCPSGFSRGPDAAEPFRAAVEKELDTYLCTHYPARGGIVGIAVFASAGDLDGQGFLLRIVLSARHSRPRACWAGVWMSQWNVTWDPVQDKRLGEVTAAIDGTMEFSVHCTEDANMNFRRKCKHHTPLSASSMKDAPSFGKEVVAAMSVAEADFHEATEEQCILMGSGPLKSLRRVLPMSREKFDWRPIRHSLVKDMKAAAKDSESAVAESVTM